MNKNLVLKKKFLLLHLVSLIRSAPTKLPQDRKVARVSG